LLEGKQKSSGEIFDNIKYLILFSKMQVSGKKRENWILNMALERKDKIRIIEQYHDEGDLSIYKGRVCYDENEWIYTEAMILIDKRLVTLIDITLEQWLDLKIRDRKKVDKKVMEEMVNTWLIRIYKKQFEEYMEIKRQLEVSGIGHDVEYEPIDIDFAEWLASNFSNHKTMDRYTKNALWIYWKIGDDEEVIIDDE
ncbi:hypothetical protein Tco_0700815, partial [Tanacetum coccineum]